MADPTISWNGDATSLLKAYADLDAARKREAAGLMDLKSKHNDAAKAEREASREAEAIKARALTAQDRHNAAVTRARELLDKGKISQKEFNVELERQSKLLRESEGAADGLGSKLAGAGKDAVVAITGIGSALGAVMAVAATIKQEYEAFKQREAEILRSHQTFGGAMRGLALDFTPDETMSAGDLEGAVKGLMTRTGATDVIAAQVMSQAMAGRGTLSNAAAGGLAELALKLYPESGEEAGLMAMSTGMLMNQSGIADPRAAMGMAAQIKNASMVVKMRDIAQSGITSVSAGVSGGDTAEQAAELYSAISNITGDSLGATSATAFVALKEKLAGFEPGKKSKVPKDVLRRLMEAQGTTAKLAVVQSSPELQEEIGVEGFEKKAIDGMRRLMAGEGKAMAALADAQAKITAPNAASYEQWLATANTPFSQLGATADRGVANALAQYKLRQSADSARGRKALDDSLTTLGTPGVDWITGSMASTAYELSTASGASPDKAFGDAAQVASMGWSHIMPGPAATAMNKMFGWGREERATLGDVVSELRLLRGGPPENALGRQPAGR